MKISINILVILLLGLVSLQTVNAQVGQIIWEDNFNTLDTDRWNITSGDGCPELCGWGNEELEYYHPDNVKIEEIPGEPGNFALVLEARSEVMGDKSFTSGKVTTENKIAVKYGMIEVRMKAPDVEVGLWPAVWLLGTNHSAVGWPQCGEIDIMEMGQKQVFLSNKGIGDASPNQVAGSNLLFFDDEACTSENADCAASIAFDNYYCTPYKAGVPLNERFVIYRLYWDDQEIKFTVEDNGVTHEMYAGPFPIGHAAQEFKKPFYLLMNLAVGGNFTDAENVGQVTASLPGKMYIDYIRIRKWNGKGEVTDTNELLANAGGDMNVAEGETVTLNAAGSYGSIASYVWSIGETVLSNEAYAEIELPVGVHNIKLTIADAGGNSASDEIVVQVGDESIGEILWEENFDSFNSDIWNAVTGNGCPELCGWGNEELQSYQPNNVLIEAIEGEEGNNALVLEARHENNGENEFTSGKVTTEDKLAIKYGLIEVRMKAPNVENGLWPAAWLLGINHREIGWPYCGEMDMMEMGHADKERLRQGYGGVSRNNYVGANLIWYESGACAEDNPTCAASIAWDTFYDKPYVAPTGLNNRYVIYRTYWDENEIRLTVEDEGVEYDLYEAPFPITDVTDAFRKPFYFILNLAVGGQFTGLLEPNDITSPLPNKMYVDYVRVRKWKGRGEVSYVDGNSLANAGADQAIVDSDKDGVETVSLNGTGSYGDIVSYDWSENGAQIAIGENPTIELTAGNHFLTLTTTDANGFVSQDDVMIDVREIIWEDNFNSLNTEIWNVDTGDGCPDLCGWGNEELQYYHEDNVYTEEISSEPGNHALVLEAKKQSMGSGAFTSGKVTTQNNMSIRHGLVEVRMQVPDLETGLWPAAWMLGINHEEVGWPRCGEIDMMEMGQREQFRIEKEILGATENQVVGSNLIFYDDEACTGENTDCAASISYDNYYCTPYKASNPLNDRFVIYRTYWDDMKIRFTVEDAGKEYDLYTAPFPIGSESAEFNKPFYFLLNLAVGGNFTDAATAGEVTAPFPAKLLIDYVRVMKWNGKGEVAFSSGLVASAGTDIIVIDKDGDKSEIVNLDGTGSSDQNGTITSYLWSIDGNEIASGEAPSVSLARGSYDVLLTVSDNDGNTATDVVKVVVSGGGLAPTADAGSDIMVEDDNGDDIASVTLDASSSFDSNDVITAYSWLISGIEIASGVNPTIELSTGIHHITLIVTNSEDLSDEDEIIVTVVDPDNVAPLADAGSDLTVNDDDGDDLVSITLDASASSDSDGTIDVYSWQKDGLEIATGLSPTIELSTGIHIITLVVSDNDGVSAADETTIMIVDPDNMAPYAHAGDDILLIDEDLDGLVNYTFDASLSTDSDGTISSYSWTEHAMVISTSATFSMDLSLGQHAITLTVTDDDGVSSNDMLNIVVNQLPVAIAGEDQSLVDSDENGYESFSLDASGSYDANGTIENYTWLLDETVIGTGLTCDHNFNTGTNVVTLELYDNMGSKASDEIVIIVASPGNQAPVADAGSDIDLYDNNNDGVEICHLDASASTDAENAIYSYDWYEDGLVIAHGLNPEVTLAKGIHQIELVVTDNQGATASDMLEVSVHSVACNFDACTGDYTAEVLSSGASNTSVTFIPSVEGYGDATCLLYYGTNPNGLAGYHVNPHEPFKLSNLSDGQLIYFYYTYSRTDGPENSTNACKHSFNVGDCGSDSYVGNDAPVAVAGDDKTLILPDNDIVLDGSGSYDPDSDPITYEWEQVSGLVISVSNTSSSGIALTGLAEGMYKFRLTVTDDKNASDSDEVTITVIDNSGNANLALNKSTHTSSDEHGGTIGGMAVDADQSTRWASQFSDPQWIYVDLGAVYDLNRISLTWEAAYATAYEIQVSDDAANWTSIYTEASGNGDLDDISVSASGRYVRMYGTSRATVYGYSLYEFEVYGTLSTSIGEEEAITFMCHPNPAKTHVILTLDNNSGVAYLRDISGNILTEIEIVDFEQKIDMTACQPGLYFITVLQNNSSATVKIIKQ
ncbi:PKD domain-containing protein [Carboxylicivirga sp. RSCT41]|uniref:PKD domain-containing protein n=1 Tax=Carboxylicivirga agarovorans TaxID=3417570 RepID=UPI003D3351D4